jgi:transcriptional regulator with XRE-family HTH domain
MNPTSREEVLSRFGENVWWLRVRRRYSQEHLAFLADIHRTQISLFESGSRAPLLPTYIALAAALEVPHDTLLEGITFRPPSRGRGWFRRRASRAPRSWKAHRRVVKRSGSRRPKASRDPGGGLTSPHEVAPGLPVLVVTLLTAWHPPANLAARVEDDVGDARKAMWCHPATDEARADHNARTEISDADPGGMGVEVVLGVGIGHPRPVRGKDPRVDFDPERLRLVGYFRKAEGKRSSGLLETAEDRAGSDGRLAMRLVFFAQGVDAHLPGFDQRAARGTITSRSGGRRRFGGTGPCGGADDHHADQQERAGEPDV